MVLADEIYSEILYEGQAPHHPRLARHDGADHPARRLLQDIRHDRVAHGLRYLPGEMVPHISRLIINSVSCTSTFSQRAAVAALEGRATR